MTIVKLPYYNERWGRWVTEDERNIPIGSPLPPGYEFIRDETQSTGIEMWCSLDDLAPSSYRIRRVQS